MAVFDQRDQQVAYQYNVDLITISHSKNVVTRERYRGLEHGISHRRSIRLAYGSSWTERRSRSLHRGQESGKHRPGLLRRDESLHWMGMGVSPVCPLHQQGSSLLV